MSEMEFKQITGERSRTYVFAHARYTVDNVAQLCVRPSGGHRLITDKGRLYIVAPGWLAIEVDADAWSA